MDDNKLRMGELIQPYGPQLPFDELVIALNRIYHDLEAPDYDAVHPEITAQLPSIWTEMIQVATEDRGEGGWTILDFGCGTGFEAEQVLTNLGSSRIDHITCYDPSHEMLSRCRKRISLLTSRATFTSDIDAINDRKYAVLCTNSLLHHLPDPFDTLRRLTTVLEPDAVWIAGHEPSARFLRNARCRQCYEQYRAHRRWTKYLKPGNYFARLQVYSGRRIDPYQEASAEAVRQGLFAKRPPAELVNRLVDLYVAHSLEEAMTSRGFDFTAMQQQLKGIWDLIWVKTYSHMGPAYEGRLPAKWRSLSQQLAEQFPLDGSNFSTVWRRQ